MKKLVFSIKFYFSILLVSFLLHSCCTGKNEAAIVGMQNMRFISTQNGDTSIRETLRGEEFTMFISLDLEFASLLIENPLMTSAYGVSCPIDFLNAINTNSVELLCNQDIEYDGSVISAGTNFKDNENISVDVFEEDMEFRFQNLFMSKAVFTNGMHTFTVRATTDDGVTFESMGSVDIQI